MHDQPGGGQRKGAAVEGRIAVLDAVFDKGKLRRGKFLPEAGLVLRQVQPLAQAQLQNQIIFCAAAAVQNGSGGVVKKGFGVGGIIEPPAAHAGVCRRAEAEESPQSQ